MTAEMILIWAVVGLIAGVLASLVVGSGYGMLGNIVVGIVGAFVGGWVFRAAGWTAPFGGLAGTIFVAFIGAVLLLVLLRLLRFGG
jgi:uncharacterized membrane protein YeaQ/YmgE (transglycosylase-associated protein family)